VKGIGNHCSTTAKIANTSLEKGEEHIGGYADNRNSLCTVLTTEGAHFRSSCYKGAFRPLVNLFDVLYYSYQLVLIAGNA
jgi:hypothetical protein